MYSFTPRFYLLWKIVKNIVRCWEPYYWRLRVVRWYTEPSGTTFITTRRRIPKRLYTRTSKVYISGHGTSSGSRFLRKYITAGTNYQPTRHASTSFSTSSIYTGDNHKTSSANYFANIPKAASLLCLNLFGSSTYFTLRYPTARHISLYLRYSEMLRNEDWYVVTDVSFPPPTVTSPITTARSHLPCSRSLKSHTSSNPRFSALFANRLCAVGFCIAYEGG